jgi:beta-hydroxylase
MNNFLDPNDFPFLKEIKNNFQLIYDEFNAVTTLTQPWMESHLHNGKWDVIGLKFNHQDISMAKNIYPKTCQVFDSFGDKVKTYGFSIMRSGCEIYEHIDEDHIGTNILRGHLCLSNNPDCALVVNGEVKNWEVGELIVFDDTNPHSAYNRGTTDRIVLLFDFYSTDELESL